MRQFLHAILLVFLVSCSAAPQKPYRTIDGFAQGTTYSIVYQDSADLKVAIEAFLGRFDNSLSIYNDSSLLTAVNENRTDVVDAWFEQCFAISADINTSSGGLFEPTLRPLISAYGFSKEQPHDYSDAQIDSVKQLVGFNKLKIENGRVIKSDPRVQVDFNAIAKGYSVDVAAKMLDSLGIENYMVEIGGEIFARGVNSKGERWRIGIDVPYEGNITPGKDLQTIIELSGRGLATSGNYRKFKVNDDGQKVVHTIDPRIMAPAVHNLLSATIIAPTTAAADGYATACMVGGLEWAKSYVNSLDSVDCYLVYAADDGSMQTYSTIKN